MKLAQVELTDPWAVRERSVVVQNLEGLPGYARALVALVALIRSEQVREQGAAAISTPAVGGEPAGGGGQTG